MKIAIIGAGFSGLTCANILSEAKGNIEIDIFELKPYLYSNTSGAISIFLYNLVKKLEVGIEKCILIPIKSIKFLFGDKMENEIIINNTTPLGYMLGTSKLLLSLSEYAIKNGCKLFLNTRFSQRNNYNYIIYADGIMGHINSLNPYDVYIGYQTIVETESDADLIIWFTKKYAPRGYIWDFKYINGTRLIGLGYPVKYKYKFRPREQLNKILKVYKNTYLNNNNAIFGGYIPTARPLRRLVSGNKIYIGDRARLCDPITGGGIGWAMLSGAYCAKAILDGDVRKYPKYIKPIIDELNRRYILKKIIYKLPMKLLYKFLKYLLNKYDVKNFDVFKMGKTVLYELGGDIRKWI